MKRLVVLMAALTLVPLAGRAEKAPAAKKAAAEKAAAEKALAAQYESYIKSVDRRLAKAQPPEKSLARFLDYETRGAKGEFVDNPDFWAKGIDFTCEAVWKTDGGPGNRGNMFGATAISPRHVLFSQHCAPAGEVELTFRGTDGKTVTRRLGARRKVPGDLFVGLLDEDLPATVTPAALLATDTARPYGAGRGLPVVTLNQHEEAVVADTAGLFWLAETSFETLAVKPSGSLRAPFFKPVVAGDSSNPRFLLLDDRAILICLMWHGNGGSGTYLPLVMPQIRAAMDKLAPGYELKEVTFKPADR